MSGDGRPTGAAALFFGEGREGLLPPEKCSQEMHPAAAGVPATPRGGIGTLMDVMRAAATVALGAALLMAAAGAAAAKSGRTYFTESDIAAIRQRARDPHYAQELQRLLEQAAILADRSDEEIWELIPEADLPRALNVRFGVGCPVHGAEVFRVGGHYPWIMSPDRPFKVKCPVGGEEYPSNDFEAYLKSGRKEKLDTTKPYVDDGYGWVDAEGNRYWFAAHYVFWGLWRRTIIDGIQACANAYIATGEPRYAHKCAVALARISQVYPAMDYSRQAYHSGKWPAGINGRILDYIWENSTVSTFAVAYDAISPTLQEDDELKRFAAARGVPDVAEAIERDILQVAVSDIFQKKIWGNKFELGSLSTIALALDNRDPSRGATTEQMVEWMLRGEGELEFTLYNGFDRDGIGGESSPGYSVIWNTRMVAAAENLARLGVDVVKDRKWLRLARGPSEIRLLDNGLPSLGDSGGNILGSKRLVNRDLLVFGAAQFDDPYCAALLLERGMDRPQLMDRTPVDRVKLERLARKDDFPPPPWSRDLGGYGLAILEMDDGTGGRSAWLYYGSGSSSHVHRDRLTIGYHMDGRDVLTELGYPAHWGPEAEYWVKNTPSHYCVMIDGKEQPTRMRGRLTRFVDLPGLKLAEAEAPGVWQGLAEDYRRMLALLDTRSGGTLLIDAFFVKGGSRHDYSFHGLPYGELQPASPVIWRQERGTMAGPDVDFGQDPPGGRPQAGWQFLREPRRVEIADTQVFRWGDDGGLQMQAFFPRLSFDEVYIAAGRPPQKPGYPASIPYIFLRGSNRSESVFLGIVDVHRGTTAVRDVERVLADTPRAGGAVVSLQDGRQWRIYVNGSGQPVSFQDGARMDAAFAAVLFRKGGDASRGDAPEAGYVAGSGSLTLPGDQTFRAVEQPELTVERLSFIRNRVYASPAVDWPSAPRGTVAFFRNGDSISSRTVVAAARRGDRTELSLGDRGLIEGRFRGAWDAEAGILKMSERTGGVYNLFTQRSFPGLYAANEDLTEIVPITGYDAEANTLTVACSREQGERFRDLDGDGISYVYITDVGPGCRVSATPAAAFGPPPAH